LRAVYSLIVITQSTMRRAVIMLVVVAFLCVCCLGALTFAAMHIREQTRSVEQLVQEQRATRPTAAASSASSAPSTPRAWVPAHAGPR
jgi:uncharacterized membrane protein affecting hemolysin expression